MQGPEDLQKDLLGKRFHGFTIMRDPEDQAEHPCFVELHQLLEGDFVSLLTLSYKVKIPGRRSPVFHFMGLLPVGPSDPCLRSLGRLQPWGRAGCRAVHEGLKLRVLLMINHFPLLSVYRRLPRFTHVGRSVLSSKSVRSELER